MNTYQLDHSQPYSLVLTPTLSVTGKPLVVYSYAFEYRRVLRELVTICSCCEATDISSLVILSVSSSTAQQPDCTTPESTCRIVPRRISGLQVRGKTQVPRTCIMKLMLVIFISVSSSPVSVNVAVETQLST